GLGEVLAPEALAEAAEGAGVERQAFRVGVGPAHVRRRHRERVIAALERRLAKEPRRVGLLERRVRVVARALVLERVPAGKLPPTWPPSPQMPSRYSQRS